MWQYNRETLSPYLKYVYDIVRAGLLEFNGHIIIPPTNQGDLKDLIADIRRDDPFLFHYSGRYYAFMDSDMVTAVGPLYSMDRNQYNSLRSKVCRTMDEISDPICSLSDELEREQAICRHFHRYIIWKESKTGDVTKDYLHDHTLLGPLLDGSGTCEGLALTFSAIARNCGLESSVIVNGTHAWNLIKIGTVISHVDVGSIDFTSPRFSMALFNCSDEEILDSPIHYGAPVVGAVCNDMYVRNGLNAINTEDLARILVEKRKKLDEGLRIKVWTSSIEEITPILKQCRRALCMDLHCDMRGRILSVSSG